MLIKNKASQIKIKVTFGHFVHVYVTTNMETLPKCCGASDRRLKITKSVQCGYHILKISILFSNIVLYCIIIIVDVI